MKTCECGCGREVRRRFARGHQHCKSGLPYVVNELSGCWEWSRYRAKTGYGWMTVDGINILAHRHFYEKHKGSIPVGMQLDHLCRNRCCVNPDHLEPVTHAENGRRGKNTKITQEIADQIRALLPTMTQREIAARFGVSHQTVGGIATYRAWAPEGMSRRTRKAVA